jgi:hypothetical protein
MSKTRSILKVFVTAILVFSAPFPVSAALVRVDATGITIPSGDFPFVEDLIVPDVRTSPFFAHVLGGVQDGLLSRIGTPGFHINFDGSALVVDGVTGVLGTFTWTIDVPVGGMHFADIASLPPEPFIPAAFLLSLEGTLTSVNGPGFMNDPLIGSTGWHTKTVLTGPFEISFGTLLTGLPDNQFAAAARHFSAMGVSYHSSGTDTPPVPEIDPGSMVSALTLLISGMLILTGKRRRG